MSRRYHHHYTRDEARKLLPQIRQWLDRLSQLREKIKLYDQQSGPMIQAGDDLGGNRVNEWIADTTEFNQVMHEFESRDLQIKNLEFGRIDFPTLIGDKEALLIWEQDEDDVVNWHEIDDDDSGT